jgi:hypothetical protein
VLKVQAAVIAAVHSVQQGLLSALFKHTTLQNNNKGQYTAVRAQATTKNVQAISFPRTTRSPTQHPRNSATTQVRHVSADHKSSDKSASGPSGGSELKPTTEGTRGKVLTSNPNEFFKPRTPLRSDGDVFCLAFFFRAAKMTWVRQFSPWRARIRIDGIQNARHQPHARHSKRIFLRGAQQIWRFGDLRPVI